MIEDKKIEKILKEYDKNGFEEFFEDFYLVYYEPNIFGYEEDQQ
jgi:hypothetical protein